MKWRKASEGLARLVAEEAPAGGDVDHRVVHVHGRARLALDRLGHEGGVALVAQGGVADQALEVEHLVRELDGVAVAQVDLDLAGAAFLRDAVDLQALGLGEVVDVVDHGAVFVDGGHRVGLARGGRAAGAAHHGLDLARGVRVGCAEVELHLRGDHGLPAARLVEGHHALQDVARRHRHGGARLVRGVVDHLQGPVGRPWRGGGRAHVGDQHHVGLGEAARARRLGPAAGDGLEEDRVGQEEVRLAPELGRRHRLAPRDAGEVGHDALDLVEAPPLQEGAGGLGQAAGPVLGRVLDGAHGVRHGHGPPSGSPPCARPRRRGPAAGAGRRGRPPCGRPGRCRCRPWSR